MLLVVFFGATFDHLNMAAISQKTQDTVKKTTRILQMRNTKTKPYGDSKKKKTYWCTGVCECVCVLGFQITANYWRVSSAWGSGWGCNTKGGKTGAVVG